MKKIFLIKALLGITLSCVGQKSWEDKFNGLVITEDNLIIKGYLKFGVGSTDKGMKIMLLKSPNDDPQIFYTLELKGYVYKKDTFRIIHNLQPYLDDNKVIERAEAKVVQNGRLILYEIPEVFYTPERMVNGVLVGPSTPIDPITPGSSTFVAKANKSFIYVIQNTKGEMVGIRKENFESEMLKLLSDAPDILERINKKVLKFKDLENIVRDYNVRF